MALNNVVQATSRISELNWLMIGINIGLFLLFTAGLLVFNIKFRFNKTRKHKNPKRMTISIVAGALMFCSLITYEFALGMWTISEKSKGINSIKYVNYNCNYHFKNLGMASYYLKETRQMLFDSGSSDSEIINYLTNQSIVQDGYSGLLNNPNVFVIMIETGDRLMINQYTTPWLWNLFKENGVYGEHCYSYNHTNVSNTISITGSYPAQSLDQNLKYDVPFDLPQILKQNNYNTRFYNDMSRGEDGYNDIGFMPTLGFDDCFFHEEFLTDLPIWHYGQGQYNRDTLVCERMLNNLKDYQSSHNDKIFCQWMTMFMHMDNNIVQWTEQLVKDLYTDYGPKLKQLESNGLWTNPVPESAPDARKRYEIWTMKTMDFDKSVGMIYNYFYGSDATDEQKNTLLIAYGDHAWYEFADGKMMTKWGKHLDDDANINLYSTVFGYIILN